MAVEMITVRWCDVCSKQDELKREAPSNYQVSVDGRLSDIDLCEEHERAPLTFATLRQFLAEYGTVTPAASKKR